MKRKSGSRAPALRLVATEPGGEPDADAPAEGAPRGRIALSKLDWTAAALIAIVLLIAPIWAATFATPIAPVVFSPDALTLEGPVWLSMDVLAGPLALGFTAAAFFVMAHREARRPVAVGAVPGLAAAFGVMALWAVLSAAAGHLFCLSLNALAILLAALLLGGMVSRLGRDQRAIGVLTLTIALAGTVIAAIGVREYLGELRNGVVEHRTFSTFGPDFLAGYLLLTLPVTLAAFVAGNSRTLRMVAGFGLALQSGCLFLTGSRAGTAMALVAVGCWFAIAVLTGSSRGRMRRMVLGAAIFIVASGVSAMPTLARFHHPAPAAAATPVPAEHARAASKDPESHSAEFRKFTWIGAVRMTTRNPLLGAGIGTFAVTYPRYAITAFTAHAHDSFLQWSGETGFPGALALLTALAAASAFIVHILVALRASRREAIPNEREEGGPWQLDAPGMLLAGFTASLIAFALHNIFDSDLYIVASLLTFSGIFGLAIAQARSLAPLATQIPRPAGRELWLIGSLVCLFIAGRACQIGASRWYRSQVPLATDTAAAVALARASAEADPWDPEPHLVLASLSREPEAARTQLEEAARIAPTGMTFYLLGRHYAAAGEWKPALDALERARACEPHNLQTLRALAETQRSAGLPDLAKFTYQTMTSLESSPYGTVRSIPQLMEMDFAYAHAGLADLAMERNNLEDASVQYAAAAGLLRRYWETRVWMVNEVRQPEKRQALVELYERVLRAKTAVCKRLGRDKEASDAAAELQKLESDLRSDADKSSAAGG
jgi:O-antigen ligase/tetratricopeptide (TPR) repeat protein